jgi:hypothetical protein
MTIANVWKYSSIFSDYTFEPKKSRQLAASPSYEDESAWTTDSKIRGTSG